MAQELMLKKAWTSIIFDGRNQKYGAYVLRELYPDNVNKSVILAVILFVLAIGGPVAYKKWMPQPVEEVEIMTKVDLTLLPPPPIDPKAPPPPPPPKLEIPQKVVQSIKFLPPVIEDDEKVKDLPPTVDEMKDAVISNVTQEGEKGDDNILDVVPAGDVGGGVIENKPEEVFMVVEQMPEFPGGAGEMNKFIAKNIKYPKQATSMGVEGRIIITFVVNSKGEIVEPTVVKGIGSGCDEEAVRVVKMMPNWSVGKQNGRAVSVKFTIPIKFALAN